MEWYEELDFDENPFTVETKYIGNRDVLEEAHYSIVSGNIIIIEGGKGTGKTKILREMIKKFGGHGRVAYIDCAKLEKELNVEHVITKKNGILGYLFKKFPRGMVLLLDNVDKLNEKNLERIKFLFDQNYLRAVVITTEDYSQLNLSESVLQRVRKYVRLRSLSEYEAVQVIRDKIGEDLLNDRLIKETYRRSDKNMQRFLNNCELVCKAYSKNKELKEDEVGAVIAGGGK